MRESLWVSEWVSEQASKRVGWVKMAVNEEGGRDRGTMSISKWGMTRGNKQQIDQARVDEYVNICALQTEHNALTMKVLGAKPMHVRMT